MNIFEQGMFQIDPNATPEQLARKREQIKSIMNGQRPRFIGEGAMRLASGVVSGIKGRNMDKFEGERIAEETAKYDDAVERWAASLLGITPTASTRSPETMTPFHPPEAAQPPAQAQSAPTRPQARPQGASDLTAVSDALTPSPVTTRPLTSDDTVLGSAGEDRLGGHDHAVHSGQSHSDWLRYSNQNAIRNQPLSPELVRALSFLPEMGVTMEVFSGGETPDRRASNSGRHLHGNSADVFFYKDGRRLDWANPDDLPIFEQIVAQGRSNGLTGFGAGDGYMQPGSVHLGFGPEAVWGADGRGANAPDWLRSAFYGGQAPTGGGRQVAGGGGQAMAVGQSGNDYLQSGPGIAELMQMASNPWLNAQQRGVVNSMIAQQQQRSDPLYQARLAQAQYDLQQDRLGLGGSAPTVQSSVPLDDGTTVMIMNDGTRRVLGPDGTELEGQAAADAIRAARDYTVQNQTDIYQGRRQGTLAGDIALGGVATATEDIAEATVEAGVEAWKSYGQLQTSLSNIDTAIAAIDNGAQSGFVYNMLPNVTQASASLENAMNRMGLDVVGAVTFGALSEGELRLAMNTAVPRNLQPTELRAWLVERREAQRKTAEMLGNAAQYLTTPGNTINGWIAQNRAQGGTTQPPAPPPATTTTPPPSGGDPLVDKYLQGGN